MSGAQVPHSACAMQLVPDLTGKAVIKNGLTGEKHTMEDMEVQYWQ